jgi:hypothetical protein
LGQYRERSSLHKIDRLLQVYEIERSDHQNASVLNAAVISVALAYIVAVAAFLGNPSVASTLGGLVLLTPFPVLSLNGYITLQVGTGMLRREYLLHLEALIVHKSSDKRRSHPRFVALYHAMLLGRRTWITGSLTALTFGSPLVTSAAFTAYVVGPIAHAYNADGAWILVAAIVYGAFILLNVCSLIFIRRRLSRKASAVKHGAARRLKEARTTWS